MTPWPDHHIVASSSFNSVAWWQFRSDVSRLTEEIQRSDLRRWAICTEDSYLFAVAFFAAIQADRHIVLPGNYQPAALAELAEHFDAILHDGVIQEPEAKLALQLPFAAANTPNQLLTPISPSHVHLTLFTSGSSGMPKAIDKNLAAIDAELAMLESIWGDQLSDAHIASTVSHQHIYGLLFRVLWPLCSGRSFDRHDLDYPEQVTQHANHNVILVSSPALLKRLTGTSVASPYRAIFSSGGPLPFNAVDQCLQLFQQRPVEIFGSTETGGIGYRQQQQEASPWQLFPTIRATLNQNGCLRLCSPFIDPASWYQTTDVCELIDNQQFILKGRIDRIVKIEEKRISLPDVEQRLCHLSWIKEAAVFPIEDDPRISLAAAIALTPCGQKKIAEIGKGKFWLDLRKSLRQWIEPVGIPRRFRVIDEIPVNSQGKRLQQELQSLFTASHKT